MRNIFPPLKWNKAIDGFDASELAEWMVNHELSLLPPNTVFPQPGQIWETVRECEVGYEACFAWEGPHFGKLRTPSGEIVTMFGPDMPDPPSPFGTARFQKAERFLVVERTDVTGFAGPKPLFAYLQPLRYQELHEGIVPQKVRILSGYTGYRLMVTTARAKWCLNKDTAYLNEDFRLVEDVV
jgi:hypothetical protein